MLTWLITLNGASLSTDMAQRCVIIKVDRPKRVRAWEEQTRGYIDQNRKALIADIVGALQSDRFELANYSRWAAWEGDILERLPEPGEAQKVILERQHVTDVESEEAGIVEDYFRTELERLGYQTLCQAVYIPSRVARIWMAEALGNPRMTTTGAARLLKQLIGEKKVRRVHIQQRHDIGRGFIWLDEANPDDLVANDLESRINPA